MTGAALPVSHRLCGWTGFSEIVVSEIHPGIVFGVCGGCNAILHGELMPRHVRQLRSRGAQSIADEAAAYLEQETAS